MTVIAPDIQVSFHECIIRGESLFLVFPHVSLAREIELSQLAYNNYDLPSLTRLCISWLNRVNTRTKLGLWQPVRKGGVGWRLLFLQILDTEDFFSSLKAPYFPLLLGPFHCCLEFFLLYLTDLFFCLFFSSSSSSFNYQHRYNFFGGSVSEYQKKRSL